MSGYSVGHRQTYAPRHVRVGNVAFGGDLPLCLIAGPCQIESREHALSMAERLAELCARLEIPFVFKSSFDKANRTSIAGKRGIGLEGAADVFHEIRAEIGCPILTDVHAPEQCARIAAAVDILQIPAFLCRQTDLIVAAAKTGLVVNVKKGQFLAPWDIVSAVKKATDSGNDRVLTTERGASFGYNALVNDMRGLQIMAEETGFPVVFDATHSVQQPGGLGSASGGQRKFVPVLARAAVASGVAGLFVETHDDPDNAASDGPCMMPLARMEGFLRGIKELDALTKELLWER
jgi:2-dehydro-3-deoxyphosphooctonate aldolase (KDO 8-P synthase)